MSEIETFDEFEAGLARAFHREPLPVAPDRLRGAIGEIAASPARRAPDRRRRGTWGLLGIAAVLAVGGALAVVGGGGIKPAPSQPAGVPTARITFNVAWTAEHPADAVTQARIMQILRDRLTAIHVAPMAVTAI